MFNVALSSRLIALASLASLAYAQSTSTITPAPAPAPTGEAEIPPESKFPATPLASKRVEWGAIPYKVDPDTHLIRGPQHGYNICNQTTENQQSLCQTSHFNSIEDFCLWGPPEYGKNVGDIEGIMVAWCTKPGHGTRLIPKGALTGLQWTKTPDYVQVVGFFDQTAINIVKGDYGGEMDPHGADLRGNPMGGIVFSGAFGGSTPKQVIEWHNFVGVNKFCFKACDPAGPNAAHYCEHIFDRIGCDYNAPNNAKDGVFESCLGENQDFPGVYTGADGAVTTYTQPAESLGPITSIPYTARVPASSSCTTYTSASLFTGLPNPTGTTSSGASSGTGLATSRTSTGASKPTGTAAGTAGNSTEGNGAAPLSAAGFPLAALVSLVGVLASIAFLS